jgi:hypothetical protein
VARAPGGWFGPVVFWDGPAGPSSALPDCPDGYVLSSDLHHGVNEPPGGCGCACSAINQACGTNTVLHIHSDQTCNPLNMCTNATLTTTCDSVGGCSGSQGSLDAAKPTPTGGSCMPDVADRPPASWQFDSRLCMTSGAYTCDDPALVCAPTPTPPYVSQLCVTKVIGDAQSPPECPAEYPTSYGPLYHTITDQRACTECICSGVTGGACNGTLTLNTLDGCSGNSFHYTLGSGCKNFDLGPGNVHPTSVGAQYTLTAGTCTVVTMSQPDSGHAFGTGQKTVVCCQ